MNPFSPTAAPQEGPRSRGGLCAARTSGWSGAHVIGLTAGLIALACGGCSAFRYTNTSPRIERHIRATKDGPFVSQFKAAVLYPVRDILTLDPLWRTLFGDEAWNVRDGRVGDTSFCRAGALPNLTPEQAARGPSPELAPVPPISIDTVKTSGATPGFFGTDAAGRRYLVKLDHPDYPELGSAASVITSRIYSALGYYVPPMFPITLRETGHAHFDGRRAVASPLVDGVIGHFQFDWFRHRREVRGLRLVAAWLNDTDRTASNTLVSVRQGTAWYYLIDFNSSLGAWQGQPKEPWRGWRHQHGSPKLLLQWLSLGWLRPGYEIRQPMTSTAVGHFDAEFDPRTWKPQVANTAFDHLSAADARWIADRIARLKRPHLEAIVDAAMLSRPQDRAYLVDVLLARQAGILAMAGVTKTGAQSAPMVE
ncbi:MAG: hypothetical protein GY842_18195 [bacterium]|nr:hypothetical protein [bacterium]